VPRHRGQGSVGAHRAVPAGEQEIIEGLKPVCTCKGIRKSVFLKHILGGLTTVGALLKATGAGRGSCKGERCTPKIEELLREEQEKTAKGGR
jgi:NAD(P)H-nitrite reductase large subunit